MEHKSDDYIHCDWCSWYSHRSIGKRTRGLGNNRISGYHQNYSIIKIGHNTEKSAGDLSTLTVTGTPDKDITSLFDTNFLPISFILSFSFMKRVRIHWKT